MAEDGEPNDDGVTPTKKRAADGTGKAIQQRLDFSAMKGKQSKMKARFAKGGNQDTAPSITKKGVQLVVEKRDMHYVKVECKSTPSASPKKSIRTAMGLLIAKVPGVEILHLKHKNKKVRGKGGLPVDRSGGLDGFAHVKGGTAAMAKVRSVGIYTTKLSRARASLVVYIPTKVHL